MGHNPLLHTVSRKNLNRAIAALMGLAAATFFTTGVEAADPVNAKNKTRSVYQVKYWVNGEARYNKNPSRKVIKVSEADYANNTPYVCTPSGFGQKSRCYLRDLY